MPRSWEFVDATPDERAWFQDREAVLALPWEPAAPTNTQRRVLRVLAGKRSYYFKEFGPTQWKNRWRFRTTMPHALDDAEREALVTQALRAQEIEAPRPVLRGRSELGSYYLCAELPGMSLRDLLLRGERPPALLDRCAAFCGDVLKKGIWLPDLSAEHVFVRKEIAFYHFGLLDLHNATLAPAGPPPLWLCRRVLRHFVRSVQDLSLPQRQALRFAVRLLRNCGRGEAARALLRALPPFDTAARYEVPGKQKRYADRNPTRTDREFALLRSIWPGKPGERVLDVPCGAGRLLPLLRAHEHGVVWADAARAMVREATTRDHAPPPRAQANALRLPFADRAVDGVVQFRFLHHLPPHLMRMAIGEACRVANRFVVVSFFHPCSVHHVQRSLRALLTRRSPTRFAVPLRQVERWFDRQGYVLQAHRADLPFVKDLWLAAFVRKPQPAPATPTAPPA